jgi:hypothetical protein
MAHYIDAARNVKGKRQLLLNENNGNTTLPDFLDQIGDFARYDWRQAFRGFV